MVKFFSLVYNRKQGLLYAVVYQAKLQPKISV